jgi:hypothetical protein
MPASLSARVVLPAIACRTVVVALAVTLGACLPLPTETGSPPVTATPGATPTGEPSGTPEPTARPHSLESPAQQDDRQIRVAVAPDLATDASGQIVVTVTNLTPTRITELVLRWPTSLDEDLLLAPFVPSSSRICDGCPPLVQPWTKWVLGPGEFGEPAGTTSLGWGPLDPLATLEITIFAIRQVDGPVEFDLQLLAGEALLNQEGGQPAWLRVAVP